LISLDTTNGGGCHRSVSARVIVRSGGIDVLRIFLVLALLLSLPVTIFAVQNNTQTEISFLRLTATGSLALVLTVTVLIGIGIGVLFLLPGSVRARLAARAEAKPPARERVGRLETPG
jgi:uncharacterized integral membrane protein